MSCADVQTIQAGNGAKTQFSFDFPYIFKSEIQVSFWNATTKEWDVIAQGDATYPWQVTDANPTIVEFTGTAPPAPAVPVDPNETAVDNVKIRRVTNIDDIRALFNPGSAIRSDDLNKNFEQLRYAIQEANCQGIPDDVDQYLKDYYWDRFDNTLYSADTWRSDDATIATTAALDQRFQDEVNETFTKAELASNGNAMPNNDDAVPTTGAVNDYINEVITNDIGTDGTGITVTDDGDGTITLGLADNSIDFSKIKDADIITQAEQDADYDLTGDDNSIFTSSAAVRRFENFVQNNAPSGTGIGKGRVWVDPDDDLTLSVWNGTNWVGITSGGTFTNQPKVVYVDASSGDDSNDGHRISRPKKTIKAAINQVNADATYGDGSVIVVAPGTYQEVAPLDITKKDVSIIGTALRSCVIHPTVGTETNSLFRVNSGTFLQNLTFTGVKASGTRGEAGSIDPDAVYGLPGTQGWNVSFYPGAMIYKSPYIQNCTNFSDSEIDNGSLDPHTPAGGAAGDTDSQMTGGGLLIDGSVVDASSPLRSMVCDSYTHVGLDGPGILVTNNGYAQCTSSYAFFNHYHIKCLNGGQANLAASTTDFGRYGLVVDGRSTNAIFTADTTATANDGDTSFTIGTPVAGSPWHGSATRPQSNMLVDIGGNTYPILSATPNGSGWDVVISRPDPSDRSINLGLDGAVASGSPVSFYLRSMIASSGHTMEYVGSGTNYSALPENGGVPIEANQVVELNDGKVWTAITDHNGKFKVGDFFTVDQQTNAIFISSGSFNVDLQNLQLNPSGNAVIGANLDLNGSDILDSTGNVTIADTLDMNSNAIINVQDPSSANHAATKNYVDTNALLKAGDSMTGALGVTAGSAASPSVFISGDTNTGLYSPGADQVAISTNGTGRLFIDASGKLGLGTSSPSEKLHISGGEIRITSSNAGISNATTRVHCYESGGSTAGYFGFSSGGGIIYHETGNTQPIRFFQGGSEAVRIDGSGRLGLGTSAPLRNIHFEGALNTANSGYIRYSTVGYSDNYVWDVGRDNSDGGGNFKWDYKGLGSQTTYMTLDASGRLGIGTTAASSRLHLKDAGFCGINLQSDRTTSSQNLGGFNFLNSSGTTVLSALATVGGELVVGSPATEYARIDSSGRLLVGTSSSTADCQIVAAGNSSFNTVGRLLLRRNGVPPTTTAALGEIQFRDGLENECAFIRASRDGGTWTSGSSHPSNLVFSTTADGASSPTERMRIDSQGRVGIGTASPFDKLHVKAATDANFVFSSSGGTEASLEIFNDAGLANTPLNLRASEYKFKIGSDEKARIDSSGRLLVGTASSRNNFRFQVEGSGFEDSTISVTRNADNIGAPAVYLAKSRGTTAGSKTIVNNGDGLGAIWIQGSDGTNDIRAAGIEAYCDGTPGTNDMPGRLVFSTTADGASSPTERMRIDNAGRVAIGTTTPTTLANNGVTIQPNGNTTSVPVVAVGGNSSDNTYTTWNVYSTSLAQTQFYVGYGGTIYARSTSISALSDQREKENIVDLETGLSEIMALQPRRFDWKNGSGQGIAGFIAQEVEGVFPDLIDEYKINETETRKAVKMGDIIPTLVKAIQEQQAVISELQAKVAALEGN